MSSVRFSKRGGSFISYINFEAADKTKENIGHQEMPAGNGLDDCCIPRLCDKEVVLSTVVRVLKFSTFGELNSGVLGALYCTNLKLSFVPMKNLSELLDSHDTKSHWPLGVFDICLTNIESVEQLSGGKRKRISQSTGLAAPVEMIQIFCKDFRVFTFSFRFSPAEECVKALDYLGRHPFVNSHDRIFGFEESPQNNTGKVQIAKITEDFLSAYDTVAEWEAELRRTGASDLFRITDINKLFSFSESLPRRFVIPKKIVDHKLDVESKHYKDHRVLAWSFSKGSTSLLRGSSADSASSNDARYLTLLDCSRADLEEFDLELSCPCVREIHQSYVRLAALCTPTNVQEFDDMEAHFLGRMEETRWLTLVSTCLKEALKVAKALGNQSKKFVLVRERTGVDMCALVCSLVQVILDPYCRTMRGFENVVVKEWVAMGHPFAERLGHMRGTSCTNTLLEPAPIFLLFLDCVWQLQSQFPSSFEFSETYLCRVWDCSLISLYDAFVFNSNKDRSKAKQNGSVYRRLFDWHDWLSPRDLELFKNPFYLLKNKRQEQLLTVDYTIKCLDMWAQCYFRWIPKSEIVNGDPAMTLMFHLRVAKDIETLERMLECLKAGAPLRQKKRLPSDEFLLRSKRSSRLLKPAIDLKNNVVTSSFPFAPPGPIDWSAFNAKCQVTEIPAVLGEIAEEMGPTSDRC